MPSFFTRHGDGYIGCIDGTIARVHTKKFGLYCASVCRIVNYIKMVSSAKTLFIHYAVKMACV